MDTSDRSVLDVRIRERLGWGVYLVQAWSAAGQMEAKMGLTPDDASLQASLEAIRSHSADERAIRSLGARLYASLLGELGSLWFAFRDQAQSEGGMPLIRLAIEPAELAALPWELLFDERDQPVASYASLVRYQPAPGGRPPIPVSLPLRLLLAVASPGGLRPLDTESELRLIREGLQSIESKDQLEISVVAHATLAGLSEWLASSPVHVLHVVAHAFSEPAMSKAARMEGGLVFEDEYGDAEVVGVDQFVHLCRRQPELQIVVLHADRTAGLPAALVNSGTVRAVVSHQFEVRDLDRNYTLFWEAFYRRLTAGAPVDEALFEARQALFVRPGLRTADWASPILTMSGDSRVFDLLGWERGRRARKMAGQAATESFAVPGLVESSAVSRSTADPQRELEILTQRQETLEKRILVFYGGRDHAPTEVVAKWDDLKHQIDVVRERLANR